jgi:hypothetical protein
MNALSYTSPTSRKIYFYPISQIGSLCLGLGEKGMSSLCPVVDGFYLVLKKKKKRSAIKEDFLSVHHYSHWEAEMRRIPV